MNLSIEILSGRIGGNVLQAGAGGIWNRSVVYPQNVLNEDNYFLSGGKTKKCLRSWKQAGINLARALPRPAACACLLLCAAFSPHIPDSLIF